MTLAGRVGRLPAWLQRLAGAAVGGGLALLVLASPPAGAAVLAVLAAGALIAQRRRVAAGARDFVSGAVAVGLKELRGRMRGRRAFAVVTLYLALLAGFAYAVVEIQRANAASSAGAYPYPGSVDLSQVAQSAHIGQTLFAALLTLLAMLVVFLAPIFTAGAISEEREKQTFELLAATPLSGAAVVLGKLFGALGYVFLLIVASIPLMSLVFTFGGVAVEDVVRAYLVLVTAALALGALGIFFSALVRRTQMATILTYLTVLALTLASVFVFAFWAALVNYQQGATTGGRDPIESLRKRPPEALVWLNPAVAVADIVCGTSSGELAVRSCAFTTFLADRPYFGQTVNGIDLGRGVVTDASIRVEGTDGLRGGFDLDGKADAVPVEPQVNPFGVPRDLLWPQIAIGQVVFAVLLTIGSIVLVSPTRTLSLPRLPRGLLLRPRPGRTTGSQEVTR